mgnify:CR=1 FL=1
MNRKGSQRKTSNHYYQGYFKRSLSLSKKIKRLSSEAKIKNPKTYITLVIERSRNEKNLYELRSSSEVEMKKTYMNLGHRAESK